MASASEIILPIGTQKHDPAWKHCLMIRSAGRTKLKCMYCMKLFLGGGIHRIKEHLARQKGNASCCPKVPPEVQVAMQQSLEGSAARKRKKQKLVEEIKKLNPGQGEGSDIDATAGMAMIQLPDMLDLSSVQLEVREDGGVAKAPERGRKRRVKYTSPPLPCLPAPVAVALDVSGPSAGVTVDRDQVYMAIGRFLYEAGVPLDAVNSVYFQPMLDAIAAAGPGLEMFSYHDFRGWILKRAVDEVKSTLEHYKETWTRTGCSILADEWTTENGKTLINFFVYCPQGTLFLKSVDASHIVTSADTLYELFKHVVEEVGDKNVVQVITNITGTHVAAAKMLTNSFPTLFWTPCASRCIEAMLEDICQLEAVSEVIENAKSITGFVYNHAMVLNMMRTYTDGKDLLLPADNHTAMNFITLKSLTSLKEELRTMVSSEEWLESQYCKKPGGVAFTDLVCSLAFWSSCEAIVRITEPLLLVLKLVESNKRPAMGYVYVAMYQVKQAIKKEIVKKTDYMTYWNIIDWRWKSWNKDLPSPLYAAAFLLNPQFFYPVRELASNEIQSAVLDCIERLVPEVALQDKTQKELPHYKAFQGDFGRKMAIRARNTLLPAEWWSTYGGGCPNLMRLAIRILSQTCSTRGCERVHIPFEQIHNQRMNNLEYQRLCDLIFVRYNLRLQQRQTLRNKSFDPISIDNIGTVGDWVLEKSELLSSDTEDDHWMVLHQPVANELVSHNYEDEDFIAGLDEQVILDAGQGTGDDVHIKEEGEVNANISFT